MVDHLGYLWIATDKGVMRYNGYELKSIDLTKGFINKDIWSMLEDGKGRVWLSSISDQIGYVKEQKHKNVYTRIKGKYYQKLPLSYKDGIFFTSTVLGDEFTENGGLFFCVEKNDTLSAYDISKYGRSTFPVDERHLVSIGRDTNLYSLELATDGVVHAAMQARIKVPSKPPGKDASSGNIVDDISNNACIYLYGRIYYAAYMDSCVRSIRVRDGKYEEYHFGGISRHGKNETIQLMYRGDGVVIVLTEDNIYKLDSNLELVKKYQLDSLVHRQKNEPLSFFVEHPLWGKVVATYQNGIYVLLENRLKFQRESLLHLSDFVYCGNPADTIGFWWNQSTGELQRVNTDKRVKSVHLNLTGSIKVLPYYAGKRILVNSGASYILDVKTLATTQFAKRHLYDVVMVDTNEYYFLTKFTGFYHHAKDGTETAIDKERYKAIVYDKVRQRYCVYNHHKILFYSKGRAPVIYKREDLEAMGVNSIENILIDERYGNIFLCEEKRVLLFTDFSKPPGILFRNYVFKDSRIVIRDDMLVIAGVYGVLFSKISGTGVVSEPVVYPNTRKQLYNFVADIQVSASHMLLNTDLGVYSAAIPGAASFVAPQSASPQPYTVVATYGDSTFLLKKGDTLDILQSQRQLLFDVIKPTGASSLKYAFLLGGKKAEWQELPNNELPLPELHAGRYYTLSVRAYDDQWRSDVITLTIHIVPYWWQGVLVQRVLWLTAIALLVLLLYVVAIITRRNVIKKAARRNKLLEIELKSIYSQLNPHFIFNSLSSALFLVKTKRLDDAYEHIQKFSSLLRAYIKSSRNKYIILREEIANLKTYIELQQVRFKDRFDYDICVGEGVDMETRIPSLLLQPAVENAIDHGLLHKEQKGKLILSFVAYAADNELWCIVDDNGIGRKRSEEMQKNNPLKADSYGSSLIEELSNVFNKYERIKIDISYYDKVSPNTGTTVTIKIKFPQS